MAGWAGKQAPCRVGEAWLRGFCPNLALALGAVATETRYQRASTQISTGRQVIVDDCLMRRAAAVSPHPPLDGVTRKEDGYNYEMAYASEVSSTCEVKSPSGDFG